MDTIRASPACDWDMAEYDERQKTELFEPEQAEQYLLYSKSEIARVLRELSKRPEILTAYFNGSGSYFLTAVLGVLIDRDMVVLDASRDEMLNVLALKSEHLVCVTRQNHVTVRFVCRGLQPARFHGRSALAAPLPEFVYRPQRREFFRVVTPTYNPLRIRIPQPHAAPLVMTVVDLSCGGVGLYDFDESVTARPGQAVDGCDLELPGFGRVACNLIVRNINPARMNDGAEIRRIGCQFKGLTIDANALIQRYLHKLQLEAHPKK